MSRDAYKGQVTASVTICVNKRIPLFINDNIVAVFVEMLGYAAERWSCSVVAYCFMPDHVHLLLQGKDPNADLWRVVSDFKQKSGYWLYNHRPDVLWQKDFYDRVIRQDDDLVAHIRYILENPCRKGLVDNWEDYPYKGAIGCDLVDVVGGLAL